MNNKVDSFRKKISKLRKKICDLENELDELHNSCDTVIYTNLTLRIAELKAENKWLREALEKIKELSFFSSCAVCLGSAEIADAALEGE